MAKQLENGNWYSDPKFKNEFELRDSCEDYFRARLKDGKPLTIAGLCCYLGVARDFLCRKKNNDNFKNTIRWAQDKILADKEERLNAQVQGVIFDLKNNYPHLYKDKIEINSNVNIDTTIKIIRHDDTQKIPVTIDTDKIEDKNGL